MKPIQLLVAGIICLLFGINLSAQETFPRNDVKDVRAEAFAFTNATIVIDHQSTIKNGTLLIKDGRIEAVGANVAVPKGFKSIELAGKYIYPSLIDMYTSYGLPEMKRSRGRNFSGPEQIQSKTPGAYNANEAIKAHYMASEELAVDKKAADELRKIGFGTVLSFKADGVARGASAIVTLGEDTPNEIMLSNTAAAHYSFNKGSSTQYYPASLMGYISLLRQTYLDARWFDSQSPRPFTDQGLEAWIKLQDLPQIFEAGSWINVLRADKVGDEFGKQYIIKGNSDAYKRIKEIKATNASLIVPLNFPEAVDVEDPFDAERVSLADMLHWELAPTNPGVLESNKVSFALTTSGLKNKKDFMANLRKAIKNGLSEDVALKALTSVPAQLLDLEDQVGSLKKGLVANFIITNGELFKEKTQVLENWIQGKAYHYKSLDQKDHSGKYVLTVGKQSYNMEISGPAGSNKAKLILDDTTKLDITAKFSPELLTLNFKPAKKSKEQIRLSGWASGKGWEGRGQQADGSWVDWTASQTGPVDKTKTKKAKAEEKDTPKLGQVTYPFLAFGNASLPKQEDLLIKNATVWTNEREGVLEATDILLRNGKIAQIGKNLSAGNARVIDGTGKHLTPGIIDEHTHIGGGGNEVATNSAMVRIGDQVNSEDINLYRTLAGGVTAAQVLHGSANPIGGQSALIKLRWGESPENLKIKGADEYIKFALGENVKRSRNQSSQRYPQTRMGVEQVYMDAFSSALEYEKKWKAYNALSATAKTKAIKPRRDLADETILEIINKERFITCHSYVQSEINMLMKVADKFNFNVNTFTHILEGYKVADKMKEHKAGASTFSDWWNYKWEVRYAIPYNAAIMHNEGVVTAINSDDSNSGRRLNQEAAKSVKYGGMSEEDALKMVTLNPAKLLHLDDQMGSLKVGKDADVVLWTDHPLSVYARADKTIVDGIIYFDIKEDQEKRMALQKERARLIQKMNGTKKAGAPTRKAFSSEQMEMHCDDVFIYEGN